MDRVIQGLHADVLSGLHQRSDLNRFGVPDQIADSRGTDQNLQCRTAPLLVDSLEQVLCDHNAQRGGEGVANLRLLRGWKNFDDAVDCFGGIFRMQRAEYQMPGRRCLYRQGDGFEVSHLADEDNVRIFPEGPPQSRTKRDGVEADFSMVDDTALTLVDKFDRIFNGQDMIFPVTVRIVDHCRQSRRLSAAGRTCDQHQPFAQHRGPCQHGRQA